jgi:hypothetical protein
VLFSVFFFPQGVKMKISLMVLISAISLTAGSAMAQDRQTALDQFNLLKNSAAALERRVLAPSEDDIATAKASGSQVVRILPRETYDNSFTSIRGGGAYYSFFYRIHDYGWGSDICLEQGRIRAGFAMAELGDIPFNTISKSTTGVTGLAGYEGASDSDYSTARYKAANGVLKLDDTTYRLDYKATVGKTYIIRSIQHDYYDVLVAVKILREDTDKSLIILWKLIDQFDTPRQDPRSNTLPASDTSIAEKWKGWQHDLRFKDVQFSVNQSVVTLRGSVTKKDLPYTIQLANSTGAAKVINGLTTR